MKATLKEMDQIRQQIDVEVPAEEVGAAWVAALGKVRKEAKVPGFRQGKVPDAVLEQRFGEEIRVETVKQIVRSTYPQAVAEVQAKPLGDPKIEPRGAIEKGKPFSYRAEIEVYPEFTAEGYEGISLEREKVAVSDEEVEAELRRLQRHMTQLEPTTEGEIGPGMVAMIDFKGTAGGEAFPGSEAQNYVVDFGGGGLLEEFEVRIKGMKAADERDIEFDYPAGYFKKEIAGKKGAFRVKVKEVRRKIVPELNDEFAKELGKFATLDEVRKDLREKIAAYKESVVKSWLRDRTIRLLIEKNQKLEVPLTMIQAEINNMLEQMDRNLRAQGKSLADQKVDAKEFVRANEKEAADRARGYIIMSAISKKENITATDEEIEERLKTIAAQNRQPLAKAKEHFEKNKLMPQLKSQIIFEKTLDFVLDKAKITEVKPKTKK